jgi:hypothetical protein
MKIVMTTPRIITSRGHPHTMPTPTVAAISRARRRPPVS